MRNILLLVVTVFFTVLCLFPFAHPGGGGQVRAYGATVKPATAAEAVPAKVEGEDQPVPEVTGARPGEARTNPQDGQRYVWIPPGDFRMGCSCSYRLCGTDNEKPRHRVIISTGFWMGQTEVTVGAYRNFTQATLREAPWSPDFQQDDNHPVVCVTWEDANEYCRWAGGRLPTEAEWEYAARAGSPAERYASLDEIAWYGDNSGRTKVDSAELWENAHNYIEQLRVNGNQTHPVGKKTPNDFGLYDMLGNVWEWCADWYSEKYYQVSEERDPEGPPSGKFRVMRGASWCYFPRYVRASCRLWNQADLRDASVGFRCVWKVIP